MEDERNSPSAHAQYFAPARSYDDEDERGALARARDALSAVYSRSARRALGRLLDHERPDVAHLHTVYHQLTMSIVDELAARDIPMVQTVHDWKMACPAYTLFTEGAPCRRCVTGSVMNAVEHRCVKGSRRCECGCRRRGGDRAPAWQLSEGRAIRRPVAVRRFRS